MKRATDHSASKGKEREIENDDAVDHGNSGLDNGRRGEEITSAEIRLCIMRDGLTKRPDLSYTIIQYLGGLSSSSINFSPS